MAGTVMGVTDSNFEHEVHGKYRIRGVPGLLVFNGGNVSGQITGAAGKAQVATVIEKVMA